MTLHLKAALLTGVVAVLFVVLEVALDIKTGMAGVFIMGSAGGFLAGNQIVKSEKQ